MSTPREQLYPMGFQCGLRAWQRLNLDEALPGFDRERLFRLRQQAAADQRQRTAKPLSPAELFLWGLLNRMLHHLGRAFFGRRQQALEPFVRPLLQELTDLFPLIPAQRKMIARQLAEGSSDSRDFFLIEFCLLHLQGNNRALRDGHDLFQPELAQLRTRQNYAATLELCERLEPEAGSAFGARSLLELLREPFEASPDNLSGQLDYLRRQWGSLLPQELLLQLDTGMALLHGEYHPRGPLGPPETIPPGFSRDGDIANFTPDRDWMPRTVLLAKAVFVWLHQLSQRYGREIRRLDQIPDEELDQLRDFGFSGLWLIGIWQRSEASRRIKHLHGKGHVTASAYAIHAYRIADDLGGDAALDNLRQRCLQRGIHLACDVVTNHTGIDSQWVRHHPDWFIQADQPPYPGYRYNGADLSADDRLCIQIEDGYYDHSEAAVVFCRRDLHSGEVRYIYHGNDGTHLPWNDTAQLNFLLPEVREAMIGVILEAAQRFGIIRFDAAMTLAKKHYQRLWFPLPGGGEGVPSRSAWAMTQAEFDRLFPIEFWREVVDRIKQEQPDTLLVAEAFWLMEGYFVRTLGMHRVYNSAFMNMLKREENGRYRKTLCEILAFDPAILQRFVNFMSNPDEETAIDQFGNADKYFCVATLMCTLPGMPLFAHGQLEGLREKYGMEYTRPEWQEETDQRLLQDHWRLLAPLLRRRELFSGADNFQLYDFVSDRGLEESVFVFSNRRGAEAVLVLCNNSPHPIRGRIGGAVENRNGGLEVRQALGLERQDGFYLFASPNSPLQHLRPADREFEFELPPYAHQVLTRAAHLPDVDGLWSRLSGQIGLGGVRGLRQRAELFDIWPQLIQLDHWVRRGSETQSSSLAGELLPLFHWLRRTTASGADLLQTVVDCWFEPPYPIDRLTGAIIAETASGNAQPSFIFEQLFDRLNIRAVLSANEFDGQIWFRRESLENLCLLLLLGLLYGQKDKHLNSKVFSDSIAPYLSRIRQILQAAETSGFRLDDFLQEIGTDRLSSRQELPSNLTVGGSSAMKILFVTPEAIPFAKTGGLADVAGSLPRALRQLGHDVRVIMPCYRSARRNGFTLAKGRKALDVRLGKEIVRAGMRQTIYEGVPFHFIDAPEFFDREYLYGTPEGDYQDNLRRYTFFCRAVLEYLVRADYRPDILHLHDWQAALIPALLRTERAADPFFAGTATLLTLHNLGYQGRFPFDQAGPLGLPPEFLSTEHLEYFGELNLLKGGVVHADLINTVSPTYRDEIQQNGRGHGFEGLLRSRSRDLHGVLNGLNDRLWDPALDQALNKPFNSSNLNGKRSCKRALQKELGLAQQHDLPLVAVVSRLDRQKGIDLIQRIWPQLMERPLQFVLLGSGDREQMAFWEELQRQKSEHYAIGLHFDENLSRRIYAAADMLLVPSRYEPCGLTQMIALRYGALPVVRRTGGLADTVSDIDQHPREGNGFVFAEAEPEALLATIDRALALYPQRKRWLTLVKRGMERDFSWAVSAERYIELYQLALNRRRRRV